MTDPSQSDPPAGPLAGLRVLDLATVLAGPLAGQILGDYGAEVIKIEHPTKGDSLRGHGGQKDGHGLWWKMVARNKRCIGLYLGDPDGADLFLRLVETADVLIENFRPGTLERWGLGPERLHELRPELVICRVTGFGQTGPYAERPAFGTLMEAMSGFAHITGEADGPPTLPPFGLADSICGMVTVSAVLMSLRERDRTGRGQVIDMSILEPIVTALGPHVINYDQLGVIQERSGNRSSNNAPRNTYRTADGRWVAISSSADAVARRALELVGHPELTTETWFASGAGRAEHAEEIDGYMNDWIGARPFAQVMEAFEAASVAIAPVYDVQQLVDDPQVQANEMITTVDDPDLGPVRMQNVLFRMSESPGRVRWTGRDLGADTDQVLGEELGVSAEVLAELRSREVVA
jgi:crotonobetainyl-CoA:carnitine CoA-transferase CaiB-like acyl-CoA transferase